MVPGEPAVVADLLRCAASRYRAGESAAWAGGCDVQSPVGLETIAYRTIFPARVSWVVKPELLWLPFYGMALKALEEISVGGQFPREAMREVEEHGGKHILAGRWVVIFPEGERVRHGELGRFLQGGARLACANGVPAVPVAVDSGYCWSTQDWRKWPGQITARIGPPVVTAQRSLAEVSRLVREQIAEELADVGTARRRPSGY
ncbi:MAG: lysophospholipid acyltransferase family protein [Halorhodospira sp.]